MLLYIGRRPNVFCDFARNGQLSLSGRDVCSHCHSQCTLLTVILDYIVVYQHCSLSMRSRVYETVDRPCVCLSRHSTAAACGGFAVRTGDIDRQRRATGAQQQQRRSTSLSSKCEQCYVDSWRRKLNTDLFYRLHTPTRLSGSTTRIDKLAV